MSIATVLANAGEPRLVLMLGDTVVQETDGAVIATSDTELRFEGMFLIPAGTEFDRVCPYAGSTKLPAAKYGEVVKLPVETEWTTEVVVSVLGV